MILDHVHIDHIFPTYNFDLQHANQLVDCWWLEWALAKSSRFESLLTLVCHDRSSLKKIERGAANLMHQSIVDECQEESDKRLVIRRKAIAKTKYDNETYWWLLTMKKAPFMIIDALCFFDFRDVIFPNGNKTSMSISIKFRFFFFYQIMSLAVYENFSL